MTHTPSCSRSPTGSLLQAGWARSDHDHTCGKQETKVLRRPTLQHAPDPNFKRGQRGWKGASTRTRASGHSDANFRGSFGEQAKSIGEAVGFKAATWYERHNTDTD